jgi:hypothetical protein
MLTISTSRIAGEGDHSARVVMAVTDTGAPMEPDVAERLFDPFLTTGIDPRTGLEIAMAFGVIRQSGGEIAVQAGAGGGSTIEIRLPEVETALCRLSSLSHRRECGVHDPRPVDTLDSGEREVSGRHARVDSGFCQLLDTRSLPTCLYGGFALCEMERYVRGRPGRQLPRQPLANDQLFAVRANPHSRRHDREQFAIRLGLQAHSKSRHDARSMQQQVVASVSGPGVVLLLLEISRREELAGKVPDSCRRRKLRAD